MLDVASTKSKKYEDTVYLIRRCLTIYMVRRMNGSRYNGTGICLGQFSYQISYTNDSGVFWIYCKIGLIYTSISVLYLVILYFLYFRYDHLTHYIIANSSVYIKNPVYACVCKNCIMISCLAYYPMMVISFDQLCAHIVESIKSRWCVMQVI